METTLLLWWFRLGTLYLELAIGLLMSEWPLVPCQNSDVLIRKLEATQFNLSLSPLHFFIITGLCFLPGHLAETAREPLSAKLPERYRLIGMQAECYHNQQTPLPVVMIGHKRRQSVHLYPSGQNVGLKAESRSPLVSQTLKRAMLHQFAQDACWHLLSQTAQALCCSCFCSAANMLILAYRDLEGRFSVSINARTNTRTHTPPFFKPSAKAGIVVPPLQLVGHSSSGGAALQRCHVW